MFATELLQEKVKNHKGFSPKGGSCKFIKLNDDWGIKVYKYKYQRDVGHQDQTKMAEYGFAPKTGVMFDIDGIYFCHVTQVAIPIFEQIENESYDEQCIRWKKISEDPELCMARLALKDAMHSVGYHMWDDHAGNYGYIDGKLVFIDFGP